MSEHVRRESPLVGLRLDEHPAPAEATGVILGERPFLGHLNLRGALGDASFAAAVRKVTGVEPPAEPNTTLDAKAHTLVWLGPDEWLVLAPSEARAGETLRALREALGGTFAAVTDVSGGQTVIRVSGRHARDVLAKGCPVDLHPRAFGPGRCAQTHIAKSAALIRQVDETPAYDLVVRRSFADYLWRWLEDAAQEYGVGVTPAM